MIDIQLVEKCLREQIVSVSNVNFEPKEQYICFEELSKKYQVRICLLKQERDCSFVQQILIEGPFRSIAFVEIGLDGKIVIKVVTQ